MNLNGCEIDGVPAPSDWELCPDGLDRERAISRLRACIRQNLAVIAERDGYRAVAEQRAAEVERLRGAMEEHETTIRALSRSDVERFKENNALAAEVTRQRKAARKFSAAHGYNGLVLAHGLTSATVDPEDWAEFDAAFGFTPDSHECAGDYCEACDKCVGA